MPTSSSPTAASRIGSISTTAKAGFEDARPFGTSDDSTISLAAADLDADGDLDLALANRDGQPNVCYLNDGQGNFEQAGGFGTGTDETRAVAAADLNGDGHADLISANIGEAQRRALWRRPRWFLKTPRSSAAQMAELLCGLRTADLDGDGDVDIIVGNTGGQNAIFLNDGTGLHYEEQRFGDPEGTTYGVATGDVNGDGYVDIAVANSDGLNRVFLNLSGRK